MFVKMAVEGLDGGDPVKECLPYLPAMEPYTDDTITLFRYSGDIKEYIKSALSWSDCSAWAGSLPVSSGKVTCT